MATGKQQLVMARSPCESFWVILKTEIIQKELKKCKVCGSGGKKVAEMGNAGKEKTQEEEKPGDPKKTPKWHCTRKFKGSKSWCGHKSYQLTLQKA